tara:strand:+ start:10357 stop:11073 length:717 start_codon:yes stop_codon:yes gene_type:complete
MGFKKQIIKTSFIFLIFFNLINAQSWEMEAFGTNGISGANAYRELFKKLNYVDRSNIEGSPYNDSIYKTATFYYKDNQKIAECLTRYNAYTDELEMMNTNGDIGVLQKVDFLRVSLNNKLYIALNSPNYKKGENRFFIEKVVHEKYSLYYRESKSLKEGVPAKSGYHTATTSKFINNSEYYIKFNNGPLDEAPLTKSKLLKKFPNHQKTLKTYFLDNNINLKKESDLINLVNYYNSLE